MNRFVVAQNDGTHHMNVFRVRTRVALWGLPGETVVGGPCVDSANWADWPLVHNMQESGGAVPSEWTLPSGVAHLFKPRELLMLQSHYVNAGAQRTRHRGRVLVNFYSTDPATVTAEIGTLLASNPNLRVCPGETRSFTTTCIFAEEPVWVTAANGHFHSRGVRFTISAFDPQSGTGDQFYESLAWNGAPFLRDMAVPIPKGGGITFTCEYTAQPDQCGDADDQCCFSAGPRSPVQEQCDAFVYFYPKLQDVSCF